MQKARKITVPAAPFRVILAQRLETITRNAEENDAPVSLLAAETGLNIRFIHKVLSQGQENISFDNADRIVTHILGPMAWYTHEDLNAIYEAVDLGAVDRAFPVATVEVAA